LVKVIRLTVFVWSARYFSIAFWVSARLPATSMTLIVCGDDGGAGACAQAGSARASATKSAAALSVVVTEAPSHFITIDRTLAESRASVNPSPARELIPDRPPPLLLPENQARGTEGSNPLPSSGESANFRSLGGGRWFYF
jgi:hypothetical protein